MSRYIEEHPRVVAEKAPLHDLARVIADWIVAEDRTSSQGGWVAGVYGGRGTGKTSLLMTLVDLLRKPGQEKPSQEKPGQEKASNGERPRCVLPSIKEDPTDERVLVNALENVLFKPAATRLADDTLFLLLDHLQERRGDNIAQKKEFWKARLAEVRRKDTQPFIEQARDMAVSAKDMRKRLVKIHRDVATTTKALKSAFEQIVKALRHDGAKNGKPSILPLFVDDLDLQPHRALELLEILHLFLNIRGVVVIIAGDKDLLLSAIEQELERRGQGGSGLAPALLAKYVPQEWTLPIPNEKERLNLLWEPPEESELRSWWAVTSFDVLESLWARPATDARESKLFPPPAPPDTRGMAEFFLRRLLPASYRGINALHNRLLAQRVQLLPGADLPVALERRLEALGVRCELVPPFVTMATALDVRYPQLGILQALYRYPSEFGSLQPSLKPLDQDAGPASGNARDVEDVPVMDRLRPPYLALGWARAEARQALDKLLGVLEAFRNRNPGARPRGHFLAVSLNNDAHELAKELWLDNYPDEQVHHLDVRIPDSTGRASVADLREAREKALQQIRDEGLTSLRGYVELVARAQLPFVIWLGWALRELHEVIAYNYHDRNQKFTPFTGPSGRINPGMSVRRKLLTLRRDAELPASVEPATSHQAIVLVDLLGRSTPEQLQRFYRRAGEPVDCATRYRLQRPAGSQVTSAELTAILTEVLLLFRELREADIRQVELAFAGPDVVAFFLGRQLHAQGMKIRLYEMYTDHYEYVFDLDDSAVSDG